MSNQKVDDFDAVRSIVVTLEPFETKDRERIVRWACEKLEVNLARLSSHFQKDHDSSSDETPIPTVFGSMQSIDIKSFVSEKEPKSDNQMTAVVAYYYKFVAPLEQRKDFISADDLKNACRMSGRPIPRRPDQTLVNSLHSGLLDKGNERGLYQINTVGENLVAVTMPTTTNSRMNKTKKAIKKVSKTPKKRVKK